MLDLEWLNSEVVPINITLSLYAIFVRSIERPTFENGKNGYRALQLIPAVPIAEKLLPAPTLGCTTAQGGVASECPRRTMKASAFTSARFPFLLLV